jgi:hypothetical protein
VPVRGQNLLSEYGLPRVVSHSSALIVTGLFVYQLERFMATARRLYASDAVFIEVLIKVLEPHHLAREGFAVILRFEEPALFEEHRSAEGEPYNYRILALLEPLFTEVTNRSDHLC